MYGSMDDGSAAAEQGGDLADALSVLNVHAHGLCALVRFQGMPATNGDTAPLGVCNACSDASADQLPLELWNLGHQAEHQATGRCLQIDAQRGDDDVHATRVSDPSLC